MGWFGEEPGGLNRMYAGLFAGMAQCRVAVKGLVAGNPEMAAEAPSDISFFERRNAPMVRRLTACRRMARAALQAEKVDVIAAHFALYALPVLDFLRGQRFVFHFHGPWASESEAERQSGINIAMKRAVESMVYRYADRYIVLSAAFAEILSRQYGIARARIFVVPGGVDAVRYSIDLSRRQARERLGLPLDRPLIVTVRRLVRRVGLEGLIDAMATVRTRVPEAMLLIAGNGPLAQQLSERITSLGLQDHVRLLGFVPDETLPVLYRACDLSIVPSVALEGFGLTTIESLASGTPVLVTPIGGLPETVVGLDSDLVLPDAEVRSIADALSQALTGKQKLPSAEACAHYARAHFDWPVIARKVLEVYG